MGHARIMDARSEGGFDSADSLDSAGLDSAGFDSADNDADGRASMRRRRHYRKTLRPSPEQLESLALQPGANTIQFSVHSSLQGTQVVTSRLFLHEANAKLVISDVDGTITKSDVLGHLMPRVGYDCARVSESRPPRTRPSPLTPRGRASGAQGRTSA